MNGFAALAAKEAAAVSGFGTGLLPPSAVDGFAVGTLLSGVCVLMVIGPRRRLRRARRRPDAQSSRDGARKGAPAAARPDDSLATISDPPAGESAETVVPSARAVLSARTAPSAMPVTTAWTGLSATPAISARTLPSAMPVTSAWTGHSAGTVPSPKLFVSAWTVPVAMSVPAAPSGRDGAGPGHDGKNGYRSKHRMPEPAASDRRPESRRSAPRHAAPAHWVSSRLASRLPLYPLPVRD